MKIVKIIIIILTVFSSIYGKKPKSSSGIPLIDVIKTALPGTTLGRVQQLISSGADVNAQDSDGRSALWWALDKKKNRVTKLLVQSKADVNQHDYEGVPLLLKALRSNPDTKIIEMMLKSGANPNQGDGSFSPLTVAIDAQRSDLVKLLLDSGADVNSQDNYGETPLHKAAAKGNEMVVKVLLDVQGINVNAQNNSGLPPIEVARENRHGKIMELLARHPSYNKDYASEKLLREVGALSPDVNKIYDLLRLGADVNVRDSNGSTPLDIGAYSGHDAVVKLLLTAPGININAQDKNGWTPLHYAIHGGNEAVVKTLLAYPGINLAIKSKYGGSPLSQALFMRSPNKKIIEMLLDAGASPDEFLGMDLKDDAINKLIQQYSGSDYKKFDQNFHVLLETGLESGKSEDVLAAIMSEKHSNKLQQQILIQ